MADNYLITGYWGEPHVTPENDRGINAAIFGKGRFVLPVGEQFRAEYIGNNTIRIYDGKLVDNGTAAGIPANEYVDLLVPEAGQGMYRNDLIVFQYSKDTSTLVESGKFVVIQGTETSGIPSDPALTQNDLLSNEAIIDQMALYRVSIWGSQISAPVSLFKSLSTLSNQVCENFSAHSNSEIDNVITNTWETMENDSVRFISIYIGENDLSLTSGVWFFQINKQTNEYGSIKGISHGEAGARKVCRSKNASWQPWEWENPPMLLDAEYRTTEKWQGLPVYTKLISYAPKSDIGNSNGSYGFAIEFSTPNFKQLLRYGGSIAIENGSILPSFDNNGGYIGMNFMNSGGIALAMKNKIIKANTAVNIQAWYTKW